MPILIREVRELTPDRLTEILRRRGVLPCGRVMNVQVCEKSQTPWSDIFWLTLDFSSDAPTSTPTRLFLKTSQGDERSHLLQLHGRRSGGAAGAPLL